MKKVILIHGINYKDKEKIKQGFSPQNKRHWFPWIKKELEKKGYEVYTPLMPKNWDPDYREWKKEFEKINFDEKDILVGHSGGAGFLVRYLGEEKKKIRKLILVAPAIVHGNNITPYDNLVKFRINKNIKNYFETSSIFISDDEKDSIKESSEIYSNALGLEPIVLHNKGHFLEQHMGTKKFPELLKKILD